MKKLSSEKIQVNVCYRSVQNLVFPVLIYKPKH